MAVKISMRLRITGKKVPSLSGEKKRKREGDIIVLDDTLVKVFCMLF